MSVIASLESIPIVVGAIALIVSSGGLVSRILSVRHELRKLVEAKKELESALSEYDAAAAYLSAFERSRLYSELAEEGAADLQLVRLTPAEDAEVSTEPTGYGES